MRARVRFTKLGKLRWTSHRDVARIWERSLRRARVPLSYSAGFSPRPRLSFGLALPTGAESLAEYLDLELAEGVEEADLAVSQHLPAGIDVAGTALLGPDDGSLQQDVVACRWEIDVPGGRGLAEAVQRLMDATSVIVTRERKGHPVTDDIRPSVLSLDHGAGSGGARTALSCTLANQLDGQPRGLRPAELLTALGVDPAEARLLRTHQWIERDGAWLEPVAATDAPHAGRRAS